jgi:hypothetical protein
VLPHKEAPESVDRAAIVDEYGELKRLEAAFKPTERRLETLRKTIQSWYATEPAEKEFVVEGKKFSVTISAREWEKKVDPKRLYKAVGIRRFLELVSITLEALKTAGLQKLEILCVDQKQTGKRRLTPTPKAAVIPIASGAKKKASATIDQAFQLGEKERAA